MRKLTTNEFIEKSNEIHNNRYDYSNTIYTGCKNDVEIICSIHGKFTQNAQSHLNGHECTKCSGHYIYSKIEFIEKANIVHNKYDYSLTNYINSRNKIKIICPIHGEFIIRANNHLLGIGCSKCSGKNKNISEIIDDFNKIYDYKYDYSLVNNYKDKHSIIKIICPIHGEFEKIAYAHNNGHGCPKCGINTLSTSKFIELSKLNHNNKYDYSLVKYNGVMNTVKIICPIHGMFEQISRFHLNGSDCPNCSESKGEKEIRNYLDNNNITENEFNKLFKKYYKQCYIYDASIMLDKFNLKNFSRLNSNNLVIFFNVLNDKKNLLKIHQKSGKFKKFLLDIYDVLTNRYFNDYYYKKIDKSIKIENLDNILEIYDKRFKNASKTIKNKLSKLYSLILDELKHENLIKN